MKHIAGKIAYGLSFTVILPLLLVFWAWQTQSDVLLPVPHLPLAAWACLITGSGLMIWSMVDLWVHGNGLPMNAYPPEKLVTRGAYRYVSHPIYVAASLLCAGVSLLTESGSGLWLVTPMLTLTWLALVWGFENEDLRRRFPQPAARPLLHLSAPTAETPRLHDRISVYLLMFAPWVLGYEAIIFIGIPARPLSTFLLFEDTIPVWQWTEALYAFCYPFVGLVPLILREKRQLRSLMTAGWLMIFIGIFLQVVLPLIAQPRPFIPDTHWGELLAYERSKDGATAAFPSFHVAWALLAGHYYSLVFRKYQRLFYSLAIAIAISCITTGMHSLPDVMAGVVLFCMAISRQRIWQYIRTFFEKLANSWSAWQIGGFRIINHSIYVGVSAFVGVLLVSILLGNVGIVAIVCCLSLLGAGLWAQLVEGSAGLSRPFGYYGSILGGIIGCLVAAFVFHTSFYLIIAAFALTGPWVQAIGRLRCIVQGCCHGKLTDGRIGIRVHHEKSRVCAISHLKNQPVHITPAYSMLSNLLIGAFLWRLWYGDVALALITGLYFMLSGTSRFVEEAYRGEVQTRIWHKLKLYQWLALASVLFGIGCTLLPFPDQVLHLHWHPAFLGAALTFGLLVAFAMGMDFPRSSRRFSRLAN